MKLANRSVQAAAVLLWACGAAFLHPVFPAADDAKQAGFRLYPPDKGWVSRTLKRLPLRDKVAQLVQIRVPGRFLGSRSEEFLRIEDEIRRNRVGGVVLFAGNIYETAVLLNSLQEVSDLPLIVAADFERGAAFRIADTTSFPYAMAIGATGSEQFAYREGVVTALEARALGVHWVYAPVVDVNNNPDNPVINVRSFGEDPALVARLGAAFIRGARENGVLTTAKHFPGHGDTSTDTHIGLAVVGSDAARLDAVELAPFRGAIAEGVDSIMTAHVTIPQVTGEPEIPATLSAKVLTDLLRGRLNFQGLIVTDAMEMAGITTRYWSGLAAVRALQAGADLLLLPPDSEVAINEVVRAVERGEIQEERIDRSAERLLAAKTQLRLHKIRTVPIETIAAGVASPENRELGQEIADASITLLKDEQRLIPIDPVRPPQIFSLVLSSEPDTAPGSVFQAELRQRFGAVRTAAADTRLPQELTESIVASAKAADIIVCATIVRLVSGKGTVALPDNHRSLIGRILATAKPVIWVTFGNPYLLHLFPQVPAYLCAFSYSDVSQSAAARALSGEIAISGKMPVSIPGHSRAGDGLEVPRLNLTLRKGAPEGFGLSPDAFESTRKMLEGYVNDQAFPGAVLMAGFRDYLVLEASAGRLEYAPGSDLAGVDSIYDLASLSKVVGTTSAAMKLVEAGRLLLEAPVKDYLPEFKGAGKDQVKVSHLLTHSAGLPAWLPLFKEARGRAEVMKRVFDVPLEYTPGLRCQYSDLGMILMGEIVTRCAGRPLDRYVLEELCAPLGMRSTMYTPPKHLTARIAPTENDPWRGRVVRAEVHDENAFAMGGVAGHAGLFSTAGDLAVFAQMMLNQGLYDHRRFVKPGTVARFTALQGPPDSAQGLGWRKPSAANWTGRVFSPSAFGHTGFTGTSIWIDPERQCFIILLSNRVHPTRQNQKIEEARRTLAESVMSVLGAASTGSRQAP